MNNLTKLFCDLISVGTQLNDSSVSTEHIGQHVRYLAYSRLPEDCEVDADKIDEHIANCRTAMKGSDYDIDKTCVALAQGKPVSIRRIVEFHNKLSVTLSDGSTTSFNADDVVHY